MSVDHVVLVLVFGPADFCLFSLNYLHPQVHTITHLIAPLKRHGQRRAV
uniref:Uncharacterized protein n=1 Tax=Anguilla anguilla TaxID=7936 RepID=A0A0E9QC79_ANGAN